MVVVTPIPTSDSLAQLSFRLLDGHRSADEDPELSWAAVAVVLTPDPDSVLLIRRAERTGDPWSGHMALPGGRREAGREAPGHLNSGVLGRSRLQSFSGAPGRSSAGRCPPYAESAPAGHSSVRLRSSFPTLPSHQRRGGLDALGRSRGTWSAGRSPSGTDRASGPFAPDAGLPNWCRHRLGPHRKNFDQLTDPTGIAKSLPNNPV